MSIIIRPFRDSDFDSLYALWEAALGVSWPLTPEVLRLITIDSARYWEGDHLVAEQDGRIVGFIATQIDSTGKEASIPLLMVNPENQRGGIGTTLHNAAVEQLRHKAVETINLGHGPFWPGVPLEPPGVIDFFRSCGWDFTDTNYDLTRDLIDYQTPPGVLERVAERSIDIHPCSPDEAAAVLDFERHVFPFWAEQFETTAGAGRYTDILAAWDGNTVVGSLLMDGQIPDAPWHKILGKDMGGIACVGVAEQYRENGIGLALVARASEILGGRGVRQCIIDWTDLLTFYGRLGYTVWRTYVMTDPP